MISPFKSRSLLPDTPPAKKVVSCEINSWAQTCQKKQSLPSAPLKIKLNKKSIHADCVKPRTNIQDLKRLKNILAQSFTFDKPCEISPITAASEEQISPKSQQIQSSRLPQIGRKQQSLNGLEISRFKHQESHEIINVNEYTKIAMLRFPSLQKRRAGFDINNFLLGLSPQVKKQRLGLDSYLHTHYGSGKMRPIK